jgi:hypothetical protein
MNHLPYSPDLVPSDFHLSEPVTLHLGRWTFQANDELISSALNWLCSQENTFYAGVISNLSG